MERSKPMRLKLIFFHVFKRISMLLSLLVLLFLLLRVAPGDPAQSILKRQSQPAHGDQAKELNRIRFKLGLDMPLFYFTISSVNTNHYWSKQMPSFLWHGHKNQFHNWLSELLSGNLGTSYRDHRSVAETVWRALGITLALTLLSLPFAIYFGWLTGLKLSQIKNKGSIVVWDLSLISGFSIPTFLLAALLLSFISISPNLKILPVSGMESVEHAENWTFFQKITDWLSHLFLPTICMGLGLFCFVARMTWENAVNEMPQAHVKTALAFGMNNRDIRNHWIQLITFLPVLASSGSFWAAAIGGSVIVESIFSIPGMGFESYRAALERDYPTLMGLSLVGILLTSLGYEIASLGSKIKDPLLKI